MLVIFVPAVWAAVIQGDISVSQDTSCNTIDSISIKTGGSILIENSLVTETISSEYITSDSLTVNKLKSPSGVIEVEGNLVLTPTQSASFYQSTWKLEHRNDFDLSLDGWSTDAREKCNEKYYLKGDCDQPEISKRFQLPDHRFVRVLGNMHLLDLWDGERVDLKVDGRVVWSRIGRSFEGGVNVCGKEHPDAGVGVKFDVMVPHEEESALVSFSSNLWRNCHASFAVNEVALLSR